LSTSFVACFVENLRIFHDLVYLGMLLTAE